MGRETVGKLQHAESFRDLVVYQKSIRVAQIVFDHSKEFPVDERYSLTDQIRRSSRSIGAQIAESWAKRRYERHFVSKLTDADAEQLETQHWISVAASCGYMTDEVEGELLQELSEIGRMLHSMIERASSFCEVIPDSVREDFGSFFDAE